MSDYEDQRQRHLTYATGLAPRLIERLDWPADRLAAHRSQQLREMVRHAVERSPWHRDRLGGVDLDGLDEATLDRLPPMTKADLMENFDRIVADGRLSLDLVNAHLDTVTSGSYLPDGQTAITSGGSTGERGVFVYDWAAWATFWVTVFRYLLRAKWSDPELRSRPEVLGWVAAAHFTHATAALSRTFDSPEFVNVRFPVTLPTDEIVLGLNAAQPDVLIAYPSALHVLSFEAGAGRLRIAPRQIVSCAEPLLPEIRAAAEAAWGVRVGNAWGTSEGGGVAVPCDQSRSHLSDDLVIVEPVDEDGRPVAPGERSAKIYLTNLFTRALPLIRYEITDEVTFLDEPNPDPWTGRRIAPVPGRLDDTFVYDAGVEVHPHVFRSALGEIPAICEYQVRQTPRGASILVCAAQAGDLEPARRHLVGALARLGLVAPEVSIEAVDHLDRVSGTGKLKRFVPLPAGRPDRE
jgi:phenylacetate-CoA ligase